MSKLTQNNQGYYDRLQRAHSWLVRAQNIARSPDARDDLEGQFISYWIALNALYARRRTERGDVRESKWLLNFLCDLDRHGELRFAVGTVKRQADTLLQKKYLSKIYWDHGTTPRMKEVLSREGQKAKEAWSNGDIKEYLDILFQRLHVLRNQIFHGCSTDRRSLNRGSLKPAVAILEALVPVLVEIMRRFGASRPWPLVEYPRDGSPQNPDYLRRDR